jgi:hypothetical protein
MADISSTGNGSAVAIANLNTWDISQATDRTETTAFGDETKTYVSGLRDASGSFGGFWDTDGGLYNMTDGTPRKFYLYESSALSSYWFGTATFDISTTGTVGGAVEVSGSWAASTNIQRVQA